MKHAFLITCILIVGESFSQIDAKMIKGSDTLEISLTLPEKMIHDNDIFLNLQYEFEYRDENKKRIKVQPKEVDCLIFNYKDEEVVMLRQPNILKEDFVTLYYKKNEILIRRVKDGDLQVYKFYYWADKLGNPRLPESGNVVFPIPKSLIKLRNERIQELPEIFSFRKDMKKLLKDCTSVTEELESKDYQRDDIEKIAELYNQECSLNP